MFTNFKVGDLCELTDDSYSNLKEGDQFIIAKIHDDGLIGVLFKGEYMEMKSHRCRKIEDWKVGDTAEYIEERNYFNLKKGDRFIVTALGKNFDGEQTLFRLPVSDPDHGIKNITVSKCKKVIPKEVVMPPEQFQVGDTVEVIELVLSGDLKIGDQFVVTGLSTACFKPTLLRLPVGHPNHNYHDIFASKCKKVITKTPEIPTIQSETIMTSEPFQVGDTVKINCSDQFFTVTGFGVCADLPTLKWLPTDDIYYSYHGVYASHCSKVEIDNVWRIGDTAEFNGDYTVALSPDEVLPIHKGDRFIVTGLARMSYKNEQVLLRLLVDHPKHRYYDILASDCKKVIPEKVTTTSQVSIPVDESPKEVVTMIPEIPTTQPETITEQFAIGDTVKVIEAPPYHNLKIGDQFVVTGVSSLDNKQTLLHLPVTHRDHHSCDIYASGCKKVIPKITTTQPETVDTPTWLIGSTVYLSTVFVGALIRFFS